MLNVIYLNKSITVQFLYQTGFIYKKYMKLKYFLGNVIQLICFYELIVKVELN